MNSDFLKLYLMIFSPTLPQREPIYVNRFWPNLFLYKDSLKNFGNVDYMLLLEIFPINYVSWSERLRKKISLGIF